MTPAAMHSGSERDCKQFHVLLESDEALMGLDYSGKRIKATYVRVTHPQFFRTFGGCLDTCIVYTGKRNWETKLQNITQSFDDPFGSWPQGKELLHPSGGAR